MSQRLLQIKRIESLNSKELAKALEFNGYGQCVTPIHSKDINGEQFLKLTEVQISLWRLPITQSRRLWSFIQQIKSDPNQLLLETTRSTNTIKKPIANKVNNLKQDDVLTIKTAESIKSSSLTKEESFLLKSKLEGMFKQESQDVNKSFVHQQKQPILPPKPPARLQKADDDLLEQYEELTVEETVEEYLEPIQRTAAFENNSSFLSKYRRNSEQLNKIEISSSNHDNTVRSLKNRPLPPPPPVKILTKQSTAVTSVDHVESDEEISDYTPVPPYIHIDEIVSISRRPLPPLPVDNQELPEYTAVIEEEEVAINVINKPAVFRRPPPLEPYLRSDSNARRSSSVSPKPFNIQEQLTSELQKKLNKPAVTLPKPPIDLPALPMPFLSSEESNVNQDLPQPQMVETSDESDSDVEDALEGVLCYRETDRKGAKMLLNGLEDGAFVVRPSRQSKYVCTLSIMHSKKMFNVGIEQNDDGMLVFGTVSNDVQHPMFYTVKELIEYYTIYPLHLYGEYIKLKNVLPLNKR
ncbi:hypothetical protein FQR65_LT04950 [Abscondita terminalis]|nr:hypothetical protein FQR65_LT04950 [Abscondita terminalis]